MRRADAVAHCVPGPFSHWALCVSFVCRPAVAIFRFKPQGPLYAVQDTCPHVAIGSLATGDALDAADIEDFAGSGCGL